MGTEINRPGYIQGPPPTRALVNMTLQSKYACITFICLKYIAYPKLQQEGSPPEDSPFTVLAVVLTLLSG